MALHLHMSTQPEWAQLSLGVHQDALPHRDGHLDAVMGTFALGLSSFKLLSMTLCRPNFWKPLGPLPGMAHSRTRHALQLPLVLGQSLHNDGRVTALLHLLALPLAAA